MSINTAAVRNPALLTEGANRFGSQCIVLAIDAKSIGEGKWEVYVNGGRTPTGIDAVEWAVNGTKFGAGEILLTSMDTDGTLAGYDIDLTRTISGVVNVPIIASGGAGELFHFAEVLQDDIADAALAASLFHDNVMTVGTVKRYLIDQGIAIRPVGI